MSRTKVLIISDRSVARRVIEHKIMSKTNLLEIIEAKNYQEAIELLAKDSTNIILILISPQGEKLRCEDIVKYIQTDQGLCFIPLIIMVYDGTGSIFEKQEKTGNFGVLKLPFTDEKFRGALTIAIARQRLYHP